MSAITRMLDRIFPKTEHRALFVGLDSSGRTTALYKMKLGEVVQTIPTIGFNVETVARGKELLTVWDVGGCDKIRPLWRHYYQGTDAVVFFVDAADRDRIEDAVEEFWKLMGEDELKNAVVLVFANKQDLANALTSDEVAQMIGLERLNGRHRWRILPACAPTGDGLFDGVDWILATLALAGSAPNCQLSGRDGAGELRDSKAGADAKEEEAARKQEELLTEWLEREDASDDELLIQLADCTLDCWDHRTHLRIAWVLLSRHGRREAMPKIFDGIKHFIENSDRTRRSRGTTFHETMTYFWVHMVHYAIVATKNPTGDFKGFLLMNPQLSNGGLFLHYYSKKLMLQTAESRTQVVLPDKVQLPSFVGGVAQRGGAGTDAPPLRQPALMADDEFLACCLRGAPPSWGHEPRLRLIWAALRNAGDNQPAGRAAAREALQSLDGAQHNTTAATFWVQMVTLCIARCGKSASVPVLTFAQFIQRPECQLLRNPDLIDKHYSERALQGGVVSFAMPDKQPYPSIVR